MDLVFGATSLIGGGAGALDAIQTSPGDWTMSAGDMARITQAGGVTHYQLVASGVAEDSPYVIKPDESSTGVAYTGSLRWHLVQSGYVDRGNVTSFDLEKAAMSLDSAWHDWDLSSIIPPGSVLVKLGIWHTNTVAAKRLEFKKKGNANELNILGSKNMIATVEHRWGGDVSCDSNQVIEYFATGTAGTWSNIQIVVRGWWIGGI